MVDHAAAVSRLEAELASTSRESDPYEHALTAHRLGLAYAELPGAKPQDRLRQALACFDLAGSLLDARFHPVERARVLTAAGSVHRSLGDVRKALALFEDAARLASERAASNEVAAMVNNIGLARLEAGDAEAAVARFDDAASGFDRASADGRRGRASALHNRGLARAASGRRDDLVAALADHDAALEAVPFEEAPLHHGLVQQSRGVAASTLAAIDAAARDDWRHLAIDCFTAALDVFVWPEHAVRHGIVSFNLARAWAASDGIDDLRRAMLHLEDAVTAFDPREHQAHWRQCYDALVALDARLGETAGRTDLRRSDHLVALLARDREGAPTLMRRRLTRWLVLPDAARRSALVDFVFAAARQGEQHGPGERAIALLLTTAMELPVAAQTIVFDALVAARRTTDDAGREVLDHLADRAIGDALNGPQRVFVRDHLVTAGFERP